jgi:NADH dehydrogenase [ubiquinone] 1 alpha subcomplex assembly factor 7
MPPMTAAHLEATPLAGKLAARIRDQGPISLHDYIDACLYDPKFGYYKKKDPLGRGGDFITAPEISQVFGELIGLWAGETWRIMGEPGAVHLIEPGPGRGTLMSDALRALRVLPSFLQSVRVHLIETSEPLRAAQKAVLAGAACPVVWHDALEDVPAGASIVIANEFLDCLPVRQFAYDGEAQRWRERMVAWENGRFRLTLGMESWEVPPHSVPLPAASARGCSLYGCQARQGEHDGREDAGTYVPLGKGVTAGSPSPLGERAWVRGDSAGIENGSIVEIRPAVPGILQSFASRAAHAPFAALIIDYGYARPAFGETVQAVRNQGFTDIFKAPGETDITSHVDFSDLAEIAALSNLKALGPMPMGEWLLRLGLEARFAQLVQRASEAEAKEIRSRISRLVAPAQMGALFKVMGLTSSGLGPLPPFL